MQNNISSEFENMKMADLLARHNQLVALLPRLGISLGFGERTVAQVCAENRVSTPLFKLVCNAYTCDDYAPDIEELRQCPMSDIVHYLKASHADYLQFQFPHIQKHLKEVVQDWDARYRTSILNFFDEYQREVASHFQFEEETVFPYIEHLIGEKDLGDAGVSVTDFESQHENIDDKLRDLTNLMIKYIPVSVPQRERVYMLMDVYALADDFSKHEIIEERILIPYIKDLEHENK